jgi:hypothetical protein
MPVSAKVASAYVDLVARTTAFEKALNDAQTHVRNFNRAAAAEMREAKGSVALLGEEIGLHLPRHLQTFIAKLPGVSAAMSAAFSTVAVLALADIVFKAGEKVVEFVKKNEDAARKNSEVWRSLQSSMALTNEELTLSNLKLEDANAKLEHKPQQNGLKITLEEAIIAADTLGKKIGEDVDKIQAQLKSEQAAGFLGWLQTASGNRGDTSGVTAQAQSFKEGINAISDNAGLSPAEKIEQLHELADLEHRVAQQRIKDWQAEVDRLELLHEQNDPAGQAHNAAAKDNVKAWREYSASVAPMSDFIGLTQQHASLEGQNATDRTAADNAAEAEKEDQKRLAQFALYVEQQKALGQMSVSQERAYWESKIHAFSDGSKAYDDVQKKSFAASIALSREFEAIRKTTIGSNDAAPVFKDTGAGADALAESIKKNAEEVAKLNLQWVEARDKELLATGQISAHTAALDIQAAHTAEYRAQLEALQDQLAELHQNDAMAEATGVPDKENLAKQQAVQTQIDKLNAQSQITQMQDALRVTDTTWKGMIDSVFDELEMKANQSQIRQTTLQFIDGINSELAKGMTGHKMDFSKVFESAAQSLAKTGIEKAEGLLFGGSHKKADGYHVHVDNMPGSGVPGVGGGIGKAASGGLLDMLNDSNWFSSLFGGRLFGAGSIFGGGHAMGGDVAAGVPIDVGELGVERFTPMVPGRITPNKEMGRGGPLIGYVDARGTDPALAAANLDRAMRQTHNQAVTTATHLMSQRQMRRPQ